MSASTLSPLAPGHTPGSAFVPDTSAFVDSKSPSNFPICSSPVTSPVGVASNSNKHACPICSQSFTRQHNLKSHLLTHSHEKPYTCDTCSSKFRRLHDLKRHLKLHSGERPFGCEKCGRRFARSDALVRHTKGAGNCSFTPVMDGDDDTSIASEEPEHIDHEMPRKKFALDNHVTLSANKAFASPAPTNLSHAPIPVKSYFSDRQQNLSVSKGTIPIAISRSPMVTSPSHLSNNTGYSQGQIQLLQRPICRPEYDHHQHSQHQHNSGQNKTSPYYSVSLPLPNGYMRDHHHQQHQQHHQPGPMKLTAGISSSSPPPHSSESPNLQFAKHLPPALSIPPVLPTTVSPSLGDSLNQSPSPSQLQLPQPQSQGHSQDMAPLSIVRMLESRVRALEERLHVTEGRLAYLEGHSK
ncbi:hypothetical protein NADFUDRAFT_47967 [Nadsonia fulvescens var. elongata DSM 6958]|uniref:C2H2-type domain-containing protein n=1 Tax=Nadsonia fulvescens var. elongata DSM 6958 TaxID=857566 RepID=A0A1E3PEH5_9ASCO|nr:hypothetical protein NADFUDRAFT_47967 [Nadsonia fulvescens var. elongata DSM 6958]